MEKLRKKLRGDEEEGVVERANEAITLSWGCRVKGFIICFVLGATLSVLATVMLWTPGFGLAVFVVFYTAGNISAMASTLFLVGPFRQIRAMCAKERALATILMAVCLVMTLCSAYLLQNFTLALIFCLLQVLAFVWYALSYIPFAREVVLKIFSICCG